jgi:hypothetical protein
VCCAGRCCIACFGWMGWGSGLSLLPLRLVEHARPNSQLCLNPILGWAALTNPRKPSVILRFCEHELEELDRLVHYYGGFPRSSIVNIALETFLNHAKESDIQSCRKRKVNLVIDRRKFEKLTEYAKTYGVHRTDLIRLAIRNFPYGPAQNECSVQG